MTSLTVISTIILRVKSARVAKITFRNLHQCSKHPSSSSHNIFRCNDILFKTPLLLSLSHSKLLNTFSVSGTHHNLSYSTSTPDSDAKVTGDETNNEMSESAITDTEEEDMTLALTNEELEKLTGGDPELVKKVRYIQLEHEILRQEGVLVPSKRISFGKWEELMSLESKGKRRKYYLYLFKIEKSNDNDLVKREERKKKRMEELALLPELPPLGEDPDGMIYGLNRNTLWMRLYDETVNNFYYGRLIQEMRFGQPIVIDCGYGDHMTRRESKNTANQLELLFSANRCHKYPFDLQFCNVRRDEEMIKAFNRKIPPLFNPEFPLSMTEKSYLDIFPNEKLVYLTPHAKEDLLEFDTDEIYIIGAMVDRTDPRPFSLAKAKKEKLRMKRLPLDCFLDWGLGNKSLTLDQMVKIMLDARLHRDWATALQHVPKRKLRYYGENDFDGSDERNDNKFARGRVDPPRFFKRPTQNDDYYQPEENQNNRMRNYGPTPKYQNRDYEQETSDRYGRSSNNYSKRYNSDSYDRGFNRNGDSNSNYDRHRQGGDYHNERPRQNSRTNHRPYFDD